VLKATAIAGMRGAICGFVPMLLLHGITRLQIVLRVLPVGAWLICEVVLSQRLQELPVGLYKQGRDA